MTHRTRIVVGLACIVTMGCARFSPDGMPATGSYKHKEHVYEEIVAAENSKFVLEKSRTWEKYRKSHPYDGVGEGPDSMLGSRLCDILYPRKGGSDACQAHELTRRLIHEHGLTAAVVPLLRGSSKGRNLLKEIVKDQKVERTLLFEDLYAGKPIWDLECY